MTTLKTGLAQSLAALLAAACTSCGGGGSGGSGGGGSSGACSGASPHACFDTCNPCGILTQAQVAAAVGVPVAAGDNSTDPHMCDFIYSDSSGMPVVQVLIYSNINSTTFAKVCHGPSSTSDSGIAITPVSGVGDDACYVQGLGPNLEFEKGCWAYELSIMGPASQFPDATVAAQEKTLALEALTKL